MVSSLQVELSDSAWAFSSFGEFPKIRGTLFGGPYYNKNPTLWGTTLGSPIFRKLLYCDSTCWCFSKCGSCKKIRASK